jgi:Xaa-Pro aminopeptidase
LENFLCFVWDKYTIFGFSNKWIEMFGTEVYEQRRKVLKDKISEGVVLFLGNDETPRNFPENAYPFRQHSSFLYYFGLDRSSLAAVIDIDNGTEIVFGDDPGVEELIWTGSLPSLKDECLKVGIHEVVPMVKLYTTLREAHAAGRTIHFLTPYRPENKIKLLRLLNVRPDQFTVKSSKELINVVVSQREIKSNDEILEMEKAIDWTVEMHVEAMKFVRPGMTEHEVAARVTEIALAKGGQLAFPVISTVRGEVLHNFKRGGTLHEGQLFLLDAGAETLMHYAGDISSTFPVAKKFTQQQRDIYNVVLDAHYIAQSYMKPGAEFREVHFAACRALFEGLKQLGLTKGDTETAVNEGAHALFFPVGIGHMIGLDVHDMEDLGELNVGYNGEPKSTQFGLKSLRLAKELKTGFTVTIEPGIYFIPQLIQLWKIDNKFDEFINYSEVEKFVGMGGVRNEEDFLITETGCRLLGPQKPFTVAEIEALRDF